jgi:hypothetical protein
MSFIVFLVEQVSFGLYIFIALGAFLTLRSLGRARGEYRATQYELERDIASYRQSNAWTILILLAEAALIVLGIQRVVAPVLRTEMDLAALAQQVQVDDLPFRTPTPAAAEPVVIDASGVVINEDLLGERSLATPTLTPTPVGTIIPNAPAVVGCDTPNATLQVPANGMVVFEPTVVRGVAFIDNFAFYRLEINGPSLGNFAVSSQSTTPVAELGELGQFVPGSFEPGEYQFRLTVFDITTTVRASCMVTIYISDPIATPTPLATSAP